MTKQTQISGLPLFRCLFNSVVFNNNNIAAAIYFTVIIYTILTDCYTRNKLEAMLHASTHLVLFIMI